MTERTTRTTPRLWTATAIVAALVSTGLLAGCLSDLASKSENDTPEAVLEADRTSEFAGSEFTFNGTDSMDPDGNLTALRFDFGDGTKTEVKRTEDARVKHTYAKPGEYTVTLTVFDDGAEGEGQLSDTDALDVAVNDKSPVEAQVLYAAPANTTATAKYNKTFNATDGVDKVVVNLSVESVLIAGSSQVQMRLLNEDGEVLADQTVTVDSGQTTPVTMEQAVTEKGDYALEVMAKSGGARVSGEVLVLYDEGFADPYKYD